MRRLLAISAPLSILLAAAFAVAQSLTPDLSGRWFSGHTGDPWTDVRVAKQSPSSVTFTYKKRPIIYCGCGDETLRIPLGRTFTCEDANVAFDFHHERAPLPASNKPPNGGSAVSVAIVFCRGDDCGSVRATNGQYADRAIVMTDGRPGSPCWKSDEATLVDGKNEVPMHASAPTKTGSCSGDFDAIEVHVRASACEDDEHGTITLSNLVVYRALPPPPPVPSGAPLVPAPPVPPPPHPPPPTTDEASESGGSQRSWSFLPAAHAAYGAGGAIGRDSGFRQSLDVGVGLAFDNSDSPWLVGGSVVTGFGAYPTYAMLDLGKVHFAGKGPYGALAGTIFTIGPAMRIERSVYPGAELSLRVYLLLAQLGFRAIYASAPGGDAQIEATLGLGLF